MENMLTAYDIAKAGRSGYEDASRDASNADLMLQNKLALKVQTMGLENAQKAQGVQNFLQSNWREMTGAPPQQPQAPVAPIPPQQPVGQPVQPAAPNLLAGQPMPQGDPSLAGAPPPQPAPAGPQAAAPQAAQRPKYPTDEELMQAVKSGRIPPQIADSVRAERVQYEEGQLANRVSQKLALVQKLSEKYISGGNDEEFQAFSKAIQADPEIAGYLPKFEGIKVLGPKEIETVQKYTPEQKKEFAAKYPDLKLQPESLDSEGTVKVQWKNGQPVKFEPVKDIEEATKTPEQLRRVYTDDKKPKVERDAAFYDRIGGMSNTELRITAANKKLPAEYRKAAQDVIDAEAAEKLKVAKAGAAVREAAGSGGSANNFSTYTPEEKEQAFKDRNLGQYKFPTGMKSLSEQKQFNKEYYAWRASGKIDASDVANQKADVGSDKFITKQLDASSSFIRTIDNNIDQLEGHIKTMSKSLNLDRGRLMNMGVREFNKKLVGTANINIYDMLVNAISTENAKLQSGGAGSVAQVAEGARVEMEKIHDRNMPVSEMIKLMKATRTEGQNRIKALKDTRQEIKQRMSGGKSGGGLDLDMNAIDAAIAKKLQGKK